MSRPCLRRRYPVKLAAATTGLAGGDVTGGVVVVDAPVVLVGVVGVVVSPVPLIVMSSRP